MTQKGLLRTALWTEILEAFRADYPGIEFSDKSGPAVTRVIKSNADYMLEMAEKLAALKERDGG